MARSTTSQTALIRAMIASGQPFLAVQTFAAELRAWWNAHRQVRRPHPLLRRQAALIVEIGKPSSQALREITRSLQQLEELLNRIQPDLLSQLSDHEKHALQTKRGEYADSLVELLRLVRGGRLPLPPMASAPEIAWILSACCRFEKTTLLDNPTAALDAAEKRKLQDAAQLIRYFLGEYMRSLPDGQTRSAGSLLIGGNPVVRPPLGIAVYNQLVHYALSVLRSPSTCKEVFQHMTQRRQPSLEPDAVTFNTILRQATTQRYEALARAVMTTTRPEQPHLGAPGTVAGQSESNKDAAPEAKTGSQPIRPMLQQIDNAVVQADSYRLVSLLQYVTASSMFLRRYRHEPGHIGVKELVMRIYPALDKKRHGRQRATDPLQLHRDATLRPKANQASRHAILNPHVLTASLNLAAKAGKTGLVLRIWRLIKRTSLQSELQSPTNDVAAVPWKIPVEAATILMSVLANEAAKAPKVAPVPRRLRQRLSLGRSRTAPQRSSKLTAHRQYARGWNIAASLRRGSNTGGLGPNGSTSPGAGELGEGLRWRAAQLLAKREYAFLVYHWQMSQKLSSWRRKRVESWMRKDQSETLPTVAAADAEEASRVQPDSRFYDALLGVFGRRVGMVQRSRNYRPRSELLSQLRRGHRRAAYERSSSPLWSADPCDSLARPEAISGGIVPEASTSEQPDRVTFVENLHLRSTNQLLEAVVARIGWNSRGRRTSLPPDAFLVRILLDMEALSLDIPIAYRWIPTHCSIATADADSRVAVPDLLQNDNKERKSKAETGAFSPYRGPRIKTVGLIARRRNSALAEKKAEEKAKKS
ncbi:hypothetical protein PSEUBRA_003773 [Kalmanozyma brasiliensis GHG001]|uniref:uncharacterized protein n=1 Tax=Kalmanozyma brasiliensis (strain GHG001) TaxID=1365824 RepID=UPI001CE9A104|nr:uncharacterized protein PSEUBRA_003773 [Kalmanozyma brasiliensis GHG001]EST06787.2 hypothetical protein PSEUBRA_003773 [Kalmanozyma brasiliensis GHG001]